MIQKLFVISIMLTVIVGLAFIEPAQTQAQTATTQTTTSNTVTLNTNPQVSISGFGASSPCLPPNGSIPNSTGSSTASGDLLIGGTATDQAKYEVVSGNGSSTLTLGGSGGSSITPQATPNWGDIELYLDKKGLSLAELAEYPALLHTIIDPTAAGACVDAALCLSKDVFERRINQLELQRTHVGVGYCYITVPPSPPQPIIRPRDAGDDSQ